MFLNFENAYFFIIAASVGIAFAVIYTNLQRSAIGKFVDKLIKKCQSEEKYFSLDDLKLSGLDAVIVRHAVKTHNGLRKNIAVKIISSDNNSDEAERLLYGKKQKYLFSIKNDADTALLEKRYGFKPASPLITFAVLALVAVTAFTAVKLTDIFSSYVLKNNAYNENETENSDFSEDNSEFYFEGNSDNTENIAAQEKTDDEKNSSDDESNVTKPTVPTLPQKKENEQ